MKLPESWADVPVGVLGLGRSGRAAARLLADAGARVYASDVADTEELRTQARLLSDLGVDVELGRHDPRKLAACDLLIVSPGIPPSAPAFQDPRIARVPSISELELAFQFLRAPVIAVTGTNGKTTTTAWIGAMLDRAGFQVGVGGNIGRALSELVSDGGEYDWIVAEVSSFQLAHIERFRPAIGALLNLRPDHLDRYGDLDRYYADKGRLFENADAESRWVLNAEDEEVLGLARGRPGVVHYFRVASPLRDDEEGAYVARDGTLRVRRRGEETELIHRSELRLLGTHNVANALAAALAAVLADGSLSSIREALREFEPLPHRLQPVVERDGVLWINDSKATNVASTRVAIRSMDRPTVLLLGGRGKGESFAQLRPDLVGNVRVVVVYGEAADRIEKDLRDGVPLERVQGSFADVLNRAKELARPGDAVLLAPACASFDMFRDYEERGRQFAEIVTGEAA